MNDLNPLLRFAAVVGRRVVHLAHALAEMLMRETGLIPARAWRHLRR